MSKKRIWLILGTVLVIGAVLCGLLALRGCEAPTVPETASPRPAAETANRPAPMPEAPEPEAGADEEPSPVQDDTGAEETALDSQTPPEEEAEPYVSPIDFAALRAVNPDIYAWIYIPNTNVDYPILQHPTEQSYYLDHNIDHSEGYPGCIYTHLRNSKNWSDPNTIIYGHNMRSGTMFASLHYFEDGEFFNNNRYIYIYTPDQGTLVYEIFAARTGGDEDILGTYDFTDEAIFRSYIYTILNSRDMSGHLRNDVPVETTDHMITLSTCTGDSSTRLLVEAVLLNVENVPEYTFAKTS